LLLVLLLPAGALLGVLRLPAGLLLGVLVLGVLRQSLLHQTARTGPCRCGAASLGWCV
jgi:uncharacterized membrane protein AbrB (regulator of aidB expression)